MGRPLVARTRELAVLLEAVGGDDGAVLSGSAGVGKTALAGAVAERAETAGSHVEHVVATETSRSIPFGALATLLPDDVNPFHPALVVGAIRRRQEALAGTGPSLLVIDDAHLLDDQSAATLLALVTTRSVRLLATVRSGEVVPDAVRALWKDGYVSLHEIAPFDRAGTQELLASILGGDVAAGTASLLWHHTGGNALYLRELARDARANGRLVDEHGMWIWRGGLTVPPRLVDLLEGRLDGLGSSGLDALGALVLGEPLSLSALQEIASLDGVAELEARQIVTASERDGAVWYRFAHPMLGAVAADHLTPTRRQRMADALIANPAAGTDLLRRAMWQFDASGVPDVELLRAGAGAVLLTQPALAQRLSQRALPHDPTPRSALLLADAHAELGQVGAARHAQALARAMVGTDEDLLHVRINEVSLAAFSERRPDLALDELGAIRADMDPRFGLEIDSMAAQLVAFSARPSDALARADRLLAASPPRRSALRATSVRVLALAMADRSVEAIDISARLLADVAAGPATPYTQGIAHIATQIARFVFWAEQDAPATDPSGRWPVPPLPGGEPTAKAARHPLFEGGRLLIQGHAAAAVAPLREAVAQQRMGEGLLRSEAVALLVVALAATRQAEHARVLLATSPPDCVALYPGLRPWAESAVKAAGGSPAAVALAFDAYDEARAAGSPISAVAYLSAAARYGASARAAAELDHWGHRFEAPISAARALGVISRANGDGKALLEAAEAHAAIGIVGDAADLGALAVAALGRDRSPARARAKSLADEMRRRLTHVDTSAPGPLVPLSRREREIALLAATGMADADIAALLVISVRTVESHLAATYRKLGIKSRRGLRGVL